MNDEHGALEREVFIATSPETVFGFLTDPQLMAHWLGAFGQLDPQPGGVFQVEVSAGNVAHGEYIEVLPFRRVVFSWGWSSTEPDLAALRPGTSLVEIELEPRHGGTLLRLRHSGLPDALQPIHGERWSVHLGCLAAFFTRPGEAPPA